MGWRDNIRQFAQKKAFDALFGYFDKDNSGELDPKELSGLLTMAIQQAGGNFTVSDNHAHMAMKSVDKNGDGKLSKDEVYVIYQGFIKNIDQFIGPKQN